MKSNRSPIQIVHTVKELRSQINDWRKSDQSISLVPTMGALHDGHMALVQSAMFHADRTIVSIFLNPTQFAQDEDLGSYPRTEEEDLSLLSAAGVSLAYIPGVSEMYSEDADTNVSVSKLSSRLCGNFRPELFVGVATIVTKLFFQCLPDYAMFGEKDYQQLQIIKRIVKDLNIPTQVVPVSTVREVSGLALSSRNQYLKNEELEIATSLYQVLDIVSLKLRSGMLPAEATKFGSNCLLEAGFKKVDYLSLCEAESLSLLRVLDRPARLLSAAWLGQTRLIDNIEVLPVEAKVVEQHLKF